MGDQKKFYDAFSRRFRRDYAFGNARVDRQFDFFARAMHKDTQRVLVIGCGSGEAVHFIAARVAKQAHVLGVDLSREALSFGRRMFRHPRVELREADVFEAQLEGGWDVIAFPDSLEHLPRDRRALLAERLNAWLGPRGRILITIPTPAQQASVIETGKGLQPIDEPVTLEDLLELARAVGGTVSYFSMISVWDTNDYVHAVIERGADRFARIAEGDRIPLKTGPRSTTLGKLKRSVRSKLRRGRLRVLT